MTCLGPVSDEDTLGDQMLLLASHAPREHWVVVVRHRQRWNFVTSSSAVKNTKAASHSVAVEREVSEYVH